MKIENFAWVYNYHGVKFIDLSVLNILVERKFFDSNVYKQLINFYNLNSFKNNLLPLSTFELLIKKYPKKKPCWCCSGLNFIDCHFFRENKASSDQIHRKLKKILSSQECLHKNVSNCVPLIIKAHSISNKGSLSSISHNNHVYGMKLDYKELKFTKLSINNASTFYGFCKKHDDLLFASFEKHIFEKTNKQLFDLCYRALCQEHYILLRMKDIFVDLKKYKDNGLPLIQQIEIQAEINSQIYFYNLGIKYSSYYKLQLEQQYKKIGHENILQHYIFELYDEYPKFQSSSCFNLEFDLLGNRLQNLDEADIQSKNIFVNCLSFQSKGYFIISWLKENNDFGKQVIDSIVSDETLINDKLFSLSFLYIQNTFVSPKWYESLTDENKQRLEILQKFWNERDKFSSDIIQSNLNSIKVKHHYYFTQSST